MTFNIPWPGFEFSTDDVAGLMAARNRRAALIGATKQAFARSCAQTHVHAFHPDDPDHQLGMIRRDTDDRMGYVSPWRHHHHDERCLYIQTRNSLLELASSL